MEAASIPSLLIRLCYSLEHSEMVTIAFLSFSLANASAFFFTILGLRSWICEDGDL
ncbi:hypothetical protein BAUCODRAFT_333024 [Baudoinia panamericana UAMH 10762]|uniref:Uncharacterized protein n=1 Tax=Baudoinia panamericana (strain UAMH 10762) TaxID=717646 RepID=M2LB21_BAUPA|nr:uncharacterized protein BAUCODRAFT_333024 [Baudoinia panamericana UAMH 10762]EMC91002.1 hypothetical protein BAUCODRAFT_333024 [Baudoinia panamericana UAMH 10762]